VTPEERAGRAARYMAEMEDGTLAEAFDAIEKQYTAEMIDARDPVERENMWRAVHVVRKVRTHFAQAIASGRVPASDVTALRRVK
jgi:hypothetical protein